MITRTAEADKTPAGPPAPVRSFSCCNARLPTYRYWASIPGDGDMYPSPKFGVVCQLISTPPRPHPLKVSLVMCTCAFVIVM